VAQTVSLKPIGATQALSVTAGSHAAVTVSSFNDGEPVNFAAFLNTGTNPVAVQMGQKGTTPAATVPVDGTPGNGFVLPASMLAPVVIATPRGPFDVTMIGTVAGPAIVYVWPVGPQ
jgi:hypothetical protein